MRTTEAYTIFKINYKQLACEKTVKFAPQEHLVFWALVLHAISRETGLHLQAKSLNRKMKNEHQRRLQKLPFRDCLIFSLQHIDFA